MDYVKELQRLRDNDKFGQKSLHKAVLMLTVIELFERNSLLDNEIYYNDTLKSTFLKIWNKVFPSKPLLCSEAYLPFWYLQNDSFWHVVPVRGKEDILSLMRDANIKPSETKLIDCVKYAELDEDLYFLMTIASGRSSLKRALLESYTKLTDYKIDRLAESVDKVVDYSLLAMDKYDKILSSNKNKEKVFDDECSSDLTNQFKKLSDDLQIALSYEYFAFLKNHHKERDIFREECPNVYTLYDRIINHPIKRTEISPSCAYVYDNFLCDLKIALMSENGSMDLIDKIDAAIGILRANNEADNNPETEEQIDVKDEREEKEVDPIENKWENDSDLEVEHVYLDSSYNIVKTVTASSLKDAPEEEPKESRKGKTWTQEEEGRIIQYFERGISTADIAERVGRTEVAIKARLAKLGLIEYTYGQDESNDTTSNGVPVNPSDFQIENDFTKAYIMNKLGEKVFSTDGKLKLIHGKIYRLKLQNVCFTIKDMVFNGEMWMKGDKKIVAYPQTELYRIMDDAYDYGTAVEDIVDCPKFKDCKLKVDGVWYNYLGDLITDSPIRDNATEEIPKQKSNHLNIIKHPLYAVRKQALLRAMGYFRFPAKIRDIARTISRTAWGAPIIEDDVEEIIRTLKNVESVEDKFILKKGK